MNKRTVAKITGWSLIAMALLAGFSVGFAYSKIYDPEQISAFKDNLLNNSQLHIFMLLGILIIVMLDLVVSISLFHFFKNDNKNISFVSTAFRIIYTMIFGIATYYLVQNFNPTELSNKVINDNFQHFQSIWSAGLILFGVHLFLVGLLMKLHHKIPKILWMLALFAGVSYVVVHTLKLPTLDLEIAVKLEMILALPMAIGELALAIWLLVKGGKENKLTV